MLTKDVTLHYRGSVVVDSGQILIADPSYIDGKFANAYGDTRDYGMTYSGACNRTLTEDGMGQIGDTDITGKKMPYGFGFASRTAYGDGVYPVFEVKSGDDFVGLFIQFDDLGTDE